MSPVQRRASGPVVRLSPTRALLCVYSITKLGETSKTLVTTPLQRSSVLSSLQAQTLARLLDDHMADRRAAAMSS
jgi:hypothetical protein